MKKLILPVICLLTTILFSGCGLMEDAFKAGVIITLIAVAIIGLLVWILHSVGRYVSKNYRVETVPLRVEAPVRVRNSPPTP